MRYWLSSSTMLLLVVGAIMGCTTEAKPEVTTAEAKQPDAPPPITKQNSQVNPLPAFTQPQGETDSPNWDGVAQREIEPRSIEVKEVEPEAVEVKIKPEFVQIKDPKKDKDKTSKDKDKDKDKKDTESKKEPPEPTEYMGKDFKYWMTKLKDTKDPTHREEAMKAVLMFGPKKAQESVNEILKQLEKHKTLPTGVDLSVRVNGIMALSTVYKNTGPPQEQDFKRVYSLYKDFLINDNQVIMKVRVLQGLPTLGPKAADAIDDVIRYGVKYTGTWEVRKEGIQTLTTLAAMQMIDSKEPPNKNALIALKDSTKDGSYLVRMAAYQGIASLAQTKMPPDLYRGLSDSSDQVKLASLRAIGAVSQMLDSKGHLKENDKIDIVKHLDDYLKVEKDKILKIWTYAAIITVTQKPNAQRLLPVVNLLDDKDLAVRMQALTIIGICGDKGKPIAYKAVLPLIYDSELGIAGAAMATLVQMNAQEAIPELKRIVENTKEHQVRRDTAADAIEHLLFREKMEKEQKEKEKKTPDKK
jgi:hypothetical protein